MDIFSKIAIITISISTVVFSSTLRAAEISTISVDRGSQGNIELQQWDPSPEDSGQCNGKKCATGGSY